MKRIRLFQVHMPEDLTSVLKTLYSGYVAEGPRVKEFEEAIARFLGGVHAVAVNSGTSAIHLALRLAGVGPGDKVITTPITSPATNVSIVNLGAEIIWADVDTNTANISPQSVRRLAARYPLRTQATIGVDWGGYPCDWDALFESAPHFSVEDAAHSLGATYKGVRLGAFAHFACFSFQAVKHITTGDGGLVATRYRALAEGARELRWFGIDRANPYRRWDDDFLQVGYKFHMNDVAASIGLAQLPYLPGILARRREIAGRYEEELADFEFQWAEYDCEPSYWFFTLFVEKRDDFVRMMDSKGIDASPVHPRNDHYTAFRKHTYASDELEGVNYVAPRMVSIPCGQWMTDGDVRRVIDAVKGGW